MGVFKLHAHAVIDLASSAGHASVWVPDVCGTNSHLSSNFNVIAMLTYRMVL